MRHDIPAADLTPAERLTEAAAILAAGLLQLRDRAVVGAGSNASPLLSKIYTNELATPPSASVTVPAG